MRKIYIELILLLTVLFFLPIDVLSHDYYVKMAGQGSKTGGDWNNAMGNEEFATALITATPGDIFHIAAGTYYPVLDINGQVPTDSRAKTFLLNSGLVLKGGYDENGDIPTGEVDNTLVQVFFSGDIGVVGDCSDDAYGVVSYAGSVSGIVLENIHIINGYDNCNLFRHLLFNEDFGGNDASDPRVSQNPLPGDVVTDYPFSNENKNAPFSQGIYYWLFKYNINKFGSINSSKITWHTEFDDCTSPSDTVTGYMMAVETGRNTNKIYERTIANLPGSTELFFSVKLGNLNAELPHTWGWEQDPIIKFELLDAGNNVLITHITGKLPRDVVDGFQWRSYGFPFILPPGASPIKLRVSNYLTTGWQESAFVMDDIQIALYDSKIHIKAIDKQEQEVSALCENSGLKILGTYKDIGVYGNDLAAQVEFKAKNSMNWVVLSTNMDKLKDPVEIWWETDNFKEVHEGYYRIRVSNPANIDNVNASTVSDSIFVAFKAKLRLPNIRVQLCPYPEREIQLGSYIDTVGINFLGWERMNTLIPAITTGTETTTGTIYTGDFGEGTYAYKYTGQGECDIVSAKLYITTISKTKGSYADTIVVCREIESSRHLNINQIIGIEAEGNWLFDSSINPDNVVANNIMLVQAPAINEGAYIFNAANAWNEATDAGYLVQGGYMGDMNAKMFRIRYTLNSANNCLQVSVKELVIIVTENIIP
ncbi:MAG: hypothetical protein LBL90_06525 [Prevotellaceae bacterium]|jgi:hypothetical protein|nr:hypothetical protein [Prevotellaceae bacterium]